MRVLGPSCALAGSVTTSLGHCRVERPSTPPTPRRSFSLGQLARHPCRARLLAACGVSLRRESVRHTLVRVRRSLLSVFTLNRGAYPTPSGIAPRSRPRIHAAAMRRDVSCVDAVAPPRHAKERRANKVLPPGGAICIPHYPKGHNAEGAPCTPAANVGVTPWY